MDLRVNKRQLALIGVDALLLTAAAYVALLLQFNFQFTSLYLAQLNAQIFLIVPLCLLIFFLSGFYRPLWRYASIHELLLVVTAVTSSDLLIYLSLGLFSNTPLPTSLYIIKWVLDLALIGGSRILIRIFSTRFGSLRSVKNRVLIIGAGAAGTMVAKELQQQLPSLQKLPVGFIDDDEDKQRCGISGVKVLGNRDDLPQLVKKHQISEVIIAIPSAPRSEIKKLARICSKLAVQVKIIPGVHELINGTVSYSRIRPVQIEDLLGREEIKTNLTAIAQYLQHETVLVTGAGGSIGSELCRQIVQFHPQQLLLLDHTENNVYDIEMELRQLQLDCSVVPIVADVRSYQRIEDVFTQYQPTIIFHAAAHKHVPLMQFNRKEAVGNNIGGTKNVAEAAHRHRAKSFLLISTDKAVHPTSVMGATKRVAEIIIQMLAEKSSTHYAAVRFGNVLGSRGSVIPLFKKQIAAGGPVTVTHPEMKRFFMTIPEAVQLVIQAAAMGNNGNIYILDMGDPVKISDLAHDLIRLSGFEPEKDIQITYTGIRPGEKLYEELHSAEEGTHTTTHERIFIAQPIDQSSSSFLDELEHLQKILGTDLQEYYLNKLAAQRYSVG